MTGGFLSLPSAACVDFVRTIHSPTSTPGSCEIVFAWAFQPKNAAACLNQAVSATLPKAYLNAFVLLQDLNRFFCRFACRCNLRHSLLTKIRVLKGNWGSEKTSFPPKLYLHLCSVQRKENAVGFILEANHKEASKSSLCYISQPDWKARNIEKHDINVPM